jgi:hypothetical protein
MKHFGQKTLREEATQEDLGRDRKTILEWILGKWSGKVWTGFVWLRMGTIGGLL